MHSDVPSYGNLGRLGGRHEYGVLVAMTSSAELDRVRWAHQLRSYRIASVLRIGVVGLMVAAMVVGTSRSEWPQQIVLIGVYAVAALWALLLAYSASRRFFALRRFRSMGRLEPFAFTAVDVLILTGFQLLSTDGIYPLLIMILLPVLVGLDVSTRRAAVVLACTLVGFAVAVLGDPVMLRAIGWPETIFRFALYAFLCATALMVVRIEERHTRSVAGLSALREELLAQTMTASEVLQRRIAEAIHDGPLQDVLAARQELIELDAVTPGDERVGRALAGLQSASERLRQATFELHPAVLEQVGLGPAVKQLAASTAQRSGIKISTDIDYPIRSGIDPSFSVWFANCCPTSCGIPELPPPRSGSESPTKNAFWMWPTMAWGSPVTLWRAAWVRDTSVWLRIGLGWMPPAEFWFSWPPPGGPMSAWNYH